MPDAALAAGLIILTLAAAKALAYALHPTVPPSPAGETDPQDWPGAEADRTPGIRVVPGRDPE